MQTETVNQTLPSESLSNKTSKGITDIHRQHHTADAQISIATCFMHGATIIIHYHYISLFIVIIDIIIHCHYISLFIIIIHYHYSLSLFIIIIHYHYISLSIIHDHLFMIRYHYHQSVVFFCQNSSGETSAGHRALREALRNDANGGIAVLDHSQPHEEQRAQQLG